ncbi:MAG: zinc metallopeptidase [Erysipelotrichaceae bacterium]|nr:zinc metallopeptidase [Erysipelotrichaceae bacterium]MBR3693051.1 zinc metallopeptidase [Erysipelotrichales bacterium]
MDILLYLGAIVLMLVAQSSVNNAYSRYKEIVASCYYTGAEIARIILDMNGLHNVRVELAQGGVLSDHFDPKANVVRLSQEVYYGKSIASVSISAHECGHALQHATKYVAIDVRNMLLPFAIVSSNLAWTAIMIGFLASYSSLVTVGLVMLIVIALFQLVTLPIELDASNRALVILEDHFLRSEEIEGAKKMLSAAAFTYVASLISTLVNVLRIVLIRNRRHD